jgi:hypothetical protein
MVGLMKEYINPILRVFSVVALISVVFMQDREIKKLKASTAVNADSIQAELFILQTQVGKYEMAAELLKEEDSVAGNKLQVILNKETE